MILGDLLDSPVVDPAGRPLGFVVDVRLVLDGPVEGPLAAPRVHGLLVSPRTGTSFLGYERTGLRAPALLARYLRWRHRGSFLVHWTDVEEASADRVTLVEGYRRWSPAMFGVAHQRP
ncbi:PRC-barrel domain containing protein [Cellulomonas sp.]|uniref:PRC-barrel domain containing protein n=1 Tax=Cellulomonas sp. TaxID=40001 RepID=UPI001B18A273|nr:PRC-barrel domain containing protein [Cellulomonas sp.]MBO9555330.1 PRC-barrel domain containing protein [Cellulomonas sp.]